MTDVSKEKEEEWPKVSYNIWYLLPHRPGYIRADRVQEMIAEAEKREQELKDALELIYLYAKDHDDDFVEDTALAALKETRDG